MTTNIITEQNPMIAGNEELAVSIFYSTDLDVPKELLDLAKEVKKGDNSKGYDLEIRIPISKLLESTIRGAELGKGSNKLRAVMKEPMSKLREELMKLVGTIDQLTYEEPHVHKCGYCGSTKSLVSYKEMYGTDDGDDGWDRCPDCGGV